MIIHIARTTTYCISGLTVLIRPMVQLLYERQGCPYPAVSSFNWRSVCLYHSVYLSVWLRPPLWSSGQSSWLQNGDVLCFLWGTNWIYVCYVGKSRPPLWSSGQSSWLQIQRTGFDSLRYQIFWEVLGIERAPLSLVSTTEELLERKSSGSGLGNRDYSHRGSAALTTWHPLSLSLSLPPQKLALTSPTSGGRSVGIVRSRTQDTVFSLLC
jgi:hypothetical protein